MGTKNNPGKYDCYANAAPDEPMFVLLGRDPFAASTVALWALARESEGKTSKEKIDEAYKCSLVMAAYAISAGKQRSNILDYLPFDILRAPMERRGATVTPVPHGGNFEKVALANPVPRDDKE